MAAPSPGARKPKIWVSIWVSPIIRLRILITRLKINYQNAHYLLKTYFYNLFLKFPNPKFYYKTAHRPFGFLGPLPRCRNSVLYAKKVHRNKMKKSCTFTFDASKFLQILFLPLKYIETINYWRWTLAEGKHHCLFYRWGEYLRGRGNLFCCNGENTIVRLRLYFAGS